MRSARPIALTFAGEAAATLATVWVTRRVAVAYVAVEVAGYLVLRQVLNWVLGVGLLGLNVSLPRALAADARPSARRRRLIAAASLAAPVLLVMALVAAFAPRAAAVALLHDGSEGALLAAATFLIATNGVFAIAAAALQGLDRFGALALARIAAFAIGPSVVVGMLAGHRSLPSVLWAWGGATAVIDVVLVLVIQRALRHRADADANASASGFGGEWRSLLGYGGPRMIGAIAQLSTVALAPTLALWCGGTAAEAAALSIAAMFGVLLGPVRLALQPVALTRLAARPPRDTAQPLAQQFVAASACAAAAFGGALATVGDRLVALWLGERFDAPQAVVRIGVAAVVLHFFCYALEGVLDADDPEHRRPRAQLAACGLFAVGVLASVEAHAGVGGILVAQLAAALLQTALYLRLVARRYGLPATRELLHGALTVGAAAALIGMVGRFAAAGALATVATCAAQVVAALALFAAARSSGASWPTLLMPARSDRTPIAR